MRYITIMPLFLYLGLPAKNDCSTEVLLDFCTRVTFLWNIPEKHRVHVSQRHS
jgi:hypothetical protein